MTDRPGSGPPTHVGPYQVLRELGRGGMGVVYEVRHPDLPDRPLALKLMLDVERGQGLARFTREAEVMARIRHRGVVAVHQLGQLREGPFLVTDFVAGQGLDRALREAPFAPRRAAEVLRELADALATVHAAGVLHRDLKPANVILRASDGAPVLLDFGIARDDRARRLTATGDLLGTPAYMSPEQADTGQTIDARTDVYGLGAILFELLTRQPPYAGESSHTVLRELLLGEGPSWPAPEPGGERPWALEAICRMAMAREPRLRYRSAEALRDDLDRFLQGQAPEALERFPAPRGRARVGLLGLGAGLALGLTTLVAASGRGAAPAAPEPPSAPGAAPTTSRPVRPPAAPPAPTPPRLLPELPGVRLEHVKPDPEVKRHLVQACFLDDEHILTVGVNTACAWRLDGARLGELALPPTGTLSRDLARLPGGVLFAAEAGQVQGRTACLGLFARRGEALAFTPWSPDGLAQLRGCAAAFGSSALVAFRVPGEPGAAPRSVVALVDAGGARRDLFEVPHLANRISVDGGLVAVGSGVPGSETLAEYGELTVVDASDLERVAPLRREPFHANVHCVAVATVGGRRQVAVGFGSGELLLVDVDDPRAEPRPLARPGVVNTAGATRDLAHPFTVRDVCFDPRSGTVWSVSGRRAGREAGLEGELRAWSAETAGERAELARPRLAGAGQLRDLGTLDLSPDGRRLLTGDDRGGAGLWLLP